MKKSEKSKTSQNTRTDGGYVWFVVFVAFMIHFICGGIIYTLGVLYSEFLEEFGHGKGNTAWINSLVPGTMTIVGPIAGALTSRFGYRVVVITGAVTAATGFMLCSFANSIFYLYFSFGTLPGIGFGFISLPTLVCVNRCFEKKRSLAIGLAVSGAGIGTFGFAQLVRFLINEYGWRGTTLIEAGITLNVIVFGALLRPLISNDERDHFKTMKNDNRPSGSKRDIDRSVCTYFPNFLLRHFEFRLLKYSVFIMFTASICITDLGYSAPYTYLPNRAEEKGIDKKDSAFLISTMGIASLIGRLVFGWMADLQCVNRLYLYGISILICGIGNFLNPFNDSYEYLLAYAAIHGIFGGVYIGLHSVVLTDLIGLDKLDKGLGLLGAFQGIANFIGPPITGWLYDGTGSYDASFYFVGCCMSLGGIVSILIPIQQKLSKKGHKSQLGNNINSATNQTKF